MSVAPAVVKYVHIVKVTAERVGAQLQGTTSLEHS